MLLGKLSRNRYLGHYKEARSEEKKTIAQGGFLHGAGAWGAQPGRGLSPSRGARESLLKILLSLFFFYPPPRGPREGKRIDPRQLTHRSYYEKLPLAGTGAAGSLQWEARLRARWLAGPGALGLGGRDRRACGRPRAWQSRLEPTSCRPSARRPRPPPPGPAPASVSPAPPARICCWGTCLCCSLFSTSSSGSGTRF